jgi:hypothetical protein
LKFSRVDPLFAFVALATVLNNNAAAIASDDKQIHPMPGQCAALCGNTRSKVLTAQFLDSNARGGTRQLKSQTLGAGRLGDNHAYRTHCF